MKVKQQRYVNKTEVTATINSGDENGTNYKHTCMKCVIEISNVWGM